MQGKRVIGWDTETSLIREGLSIPPMTCLSFNDPYKRQRGVVDRYRGRDMLRDWLRDDDVLLVGHNKPFDVAVAIQEFPELKPLFFRKFDLGLIEDTLTNEQLVDIAEGHFRWEVDEETDEYIGKKKYGLGDLFPELDKNTFRFGYGPLRDVPIERWHPGAYAYALTDADKTVELFFDQIRRYGTGQRITDAAPQARASFALHAMSSWGMRTDEAAVVSLEKKLTKLTSQLKLELMSLGFIDPKKGSRNESIIRAAVLEAAKRGGFDVTMTKGGDDPDPSKRNPKVSIGSDQLKIAAQYIPQLALLVKYQENNKLLTTYVPALLQGIHVPINAYFNPLVETGRTSCMRPNLQNLPRGKQKKDPSSLAHLVRECFIPRHGHWFCATDYDSLEIRTLAQSLKELVNGRTFIDEYNRDPNFDPHTRLAARMLGLSYAEGMKRKKAKDPEIADRRQMSKAGNFGYPGGMGPAKMMTYAFKSYEVIMSLAESKQLKNFFLAACPEMSAFFLLNSRISAGGTAERGVGKIAQLRSGRVRGGLRFPDACNGWFQGLAADLAKHALWEVTKACHIDYNSPLYGCRPVCFIHDEIICEMPIDRAPEAAAEMERIMCESARFFTPDVPITASPALMARWYKGADAVYDHNKRLTQWSPQ